MRRWFVRLRYLLAADWCQCCEVDGDHAFAKRLGYCECCGIKEGT
jgi:hypothetical protein